MIKNFSAEIDFYPSYALVKERFQPIGWKTCGADRVRTDDIQLAKLALSQLSYSPESVVVFHLPAVVAFPSPPLGGDWWA